MARGKYLSLEEARKLGKLDQFAKEHPYEGDMDKWNRMFHLMVPRKISPTRKGGDDAETKDKHR